MKEDGRKDSGKPKPNDSDSYDEFVDNLEKTSSTVWFFETTLAITSTLMLAVSCYLGFESWQANGALSIMDGAYILISLWLFKNYTESFFRIKKKRSAAKNDKKR
jgi:hypothetical protein